MPQPSDVEHWGAMTESVEQLSERACLHLEWDRLQTAVLGLCRGESARRRGLTPEQEPERVRERLEQTAELWECLEQNDSPPLDQLHDVDDHLERLQRGGVLEASALGEIRDTLWTVRALRLYLSARRERMPRLHAACSSDASLDALHERLDSSLDPDGTLSDGASTELAKLRTEVSHLRSRIIRRIEALIEKHRDILQDDYHTQREGRYVVPVRHDAHERFPGIVHGTSQSGASVYVEPRAVVEQGNRLKMAQSELDREQLRILGELSALVQEQVASLHAAAEALDLVDIRQACVLMGHKLAGRIPVLSETPCFELVQARHPLLVLDGLQVVANDVHLEAGQGLVVSGPNAGGKTVLLKTLGLSALMIRAGIPLAVGEGSRIGIFQPVLSDMGDDQSTVKNLSTFSAHISHVASILHASGPASLVLLDEPAGGTDPEQGAALACALTEAFLERGASLAATTHYEALKALALRDERVVSAAVGLKPGTMEPSFQVRMGTVGSSSAFAVARRFGLPAELVDRAEAGLPDESRRFEELGDTLNSRIAAVAELERGLQSERSTQAELNRQTQEKLAQLRTRGREQLERETRELIESVKQARADVDATRLQLRKEKHDAQALRQAEQRVDGGARQAARAGEVAAQRSIAEGAAAARGPAPSLEVGVRVHVARLRADAVVVEGPRRKRVRVAVGPMKLWVGIDEVSAASRTPSPALPAAPRPQPTPSLREGRMPDNTVDVKGLRVDDALSMMESFIDGMYGTDHRVGYVLHGHGSGALREAVRKHLADALPHVERHRAAGRDDGGDAVTVFYLRD